MGSFGIAGGYFNINDYFNDIFPQEQTYGEKFLNLLLSVFYDVNFSILIGKSFEGPSSGYFINEWAYVVHNLFKY